MPERRSGSSLWFALLGPSPRSAPITFNTDQRSEGKLSPCFLLEIFCSKAPSILNFACHLRTGTGHSHTRVGRARHDLWRRRASIPRTGPAATIGGARMRGRWHHVPLLPQRACCATMARLRASFSGRSVADARSDVRRPGCSVSSTKPSDQRSPRIRPLAAPIAKAPTYHTGTQAAGVFPQFA